MKKIYITTAIVFFSALIGAGIYYFIFNKPVKQNPAETKITNSGCLSDNEEVTFDSNRQSSVGPVDITIKDKKNGKDVFKFTINSVFFAGRWVQPRKCGIYVIKEFNFNHERSQPLPGFRVELWRYKYTGEGFPILTFAGEDKNGKPTVFYSYEFQIDFLEKLMALIEGYRGNRGNTDKYSFLIKDIETQKDIFSLKYEDIISKYPDLEGDLALNEWTKDSRYFWGNLFYGANVLGFFRVERDTWKVDILPAPPDVLGGDALNVEKGLITVHPGNVWYGFAEMTEQEIARRRAQGIGTELYIYNLFTKKQSLVATTTEPLWYFQPQWISDTELEYILPNGEKKVYKIKGK